MNRVRAGERRGRATSESAGRFSRGRGEGRAVRTYRALRYRRAGSPRARNTRSPMFRRLLSAALLVMVASATAHAGLRSSQVPVTGSSLSAFFVSQGQTIDVANGQLDLGIMSVPALTNFQVQVYGPGTSTTSFGSYNAIPVSPTLYMIQPSTSLPGSYELAAFKNSPGRLVVN